MLRGKRDEMTTIEAECLGNWGVHHTWIEDFGRTPGGYTLTYIPAGLGVSHIPAEFRHQILVEAQAIPGHEDLWQFRKGVENLKSQIALWETIAEVKASKWLPWDAAKLKEIINSLIDAIEPIQD